MCHRVMPVLLSEVEYLLEQQRTTGRARRPHRDPSVTVPDAYPGQELPLILPAPSGELLPATCTWGFEGPSSAKSKLVFNTRIETALAHARAGQGMWSEPIMHGRCLVPVLSFYESWTRNPPRRGAQVRFAYPGRKAFLLAGVQQAGRVSIVTTVPNSDVTTVHSRMPLVLGPGESAIWLGSDFARLADRSAIRLEAYPLESENVTLF